MSFTPSSSTPSSSSTTTITTFSDPFNTRKATAFGCLAGILSRILCSRILPTYASDESKEDQDDPIHCELQQSSTPCLVARLMGLDSMPDINFITSQKNPSSFNRSKSLNSMSEINFSTAQENPSSVCRSKSMNFMFETDPNGDEEHLQRRSKTSVSFRETPTYFELEDDDFLVLNFDNRSERKKLGSKTANSDMGRNPERKKQKKRRNFGDRDRINLKISASKSDNVNQSCDLSKCKDKTRQIEGSEVKKKRENRLVRIKEEEEETDSENWSPVSVLDHTEFIHCDPGAPASEDEYNMGEWYTRPKHPTQEAQSDTNGNSMAYDIDNDSDNDKQEPTRNQEQKHTVPPTKNGRFLTRIHRLAEADILNSNSKSRGIWKTQDDDDNDDVTEQIGTGFAQLILDHLLSEFLVDHLVIFAPLD